MQFFSKNLLSQAHLIKTVNVCIFTNLEINYIQQFAWSLRDITLYYKNARMKFYKNENNLKMTLFNKHSIFTLKIKPKILTAIYEKVTAFSSLGRKCKQVNL